MAKASGITRSAVVMRMRAAVKTGQSASAFISEMKTAGLSYRRTTMLADWRSAGDVAKKTGLIKYVRKDYQPSPALYAEVNYQFSREYMYKVKMQTQLKPGDKPSERFVNIMSDIPMTPGEVQREVLLSWGGWYPEDKQQITAMAIETAFRRVS